MQEEIVKHWEPEEQAVFQQPANPKSDTCM